MGRRQQQLLQRCRIWKYDEAARSFGGKYLHEFGDPCCGFGSQLLGNATGIWGATWDDVYVAGNWWTAEHRYPEAPEGRIYHTTAPAVVS